MSGRAAAALAVLLAGAALLRADQAPDWLALSMKRPAPPFEGRPDRLVLVEEKRVDVSKSDTKWRVREAVKILTVEGQRSFALAAPQSIGQDFKLVGGWKIRPDGDVRRYDSRSIVQADADRSYEFSMTKLNLLRPDEARVGDVVAWEYTTRQKSEAHQAFWRFGWSWPTLLSRFAVKVPEGWNVSSMTSRQGAAPPARDEEGYLVWEARDVPAPRSEPMGLPLEERLTTLMVRWAPADGAADPRRFESWESVGRWYAAVMAPQVTADAAVRQAAKEAAAGSASRTEAIRGVARLVQGVRYLDTAIGRSTAEPHPAPQILRNRFGDCEDKVVLTITLLKEIGVEAFPMLALTSDRGTVAPEFPAPNAFNHAIVAIKAPAEASTEEGPWIEAGPLGRLLVFDPTSSDTGLGDLPGYLQGTRAVLAHQAHGGLVTIPSLPPAASRRVTESRVAYVEGGGLDVKVSVRYAGQYASGMRAHYETVRADKRREELLSWLSGRFGKAEIRRFEVEGVEAPDRDVVRVMEFRMSPPGNDLGTLRTLPASFHLFTRAGRLDEPERTTPLRIEEGYREEDRTTIEIPAGWGVLDPLPSAEWAGAAGSYSLKARLEGTTLVVERALEVRSITAPPAEYAAIRRFFDDVLKSDGAGIALESRPSPPAPSPGAGQAPGGAARQGERAVSGSVTTRLAVAK